MEETPGERRYDPIQSSDNTTLIDASPTQVPWHHYSTSYYRAIILLLASFMCTGSYLSYDSIGAVAPYIKGDLEITGRTYGVLLAVYSLPNVVLCIIGGILTDKFGWQKTSLVFSFFLILGNFIVATSNSSSGLVIGRFVCGLGGESLIVTQTVVLSEWFRGKELGVAFGVALSLGRIGSRSSRWILPSVAQSHGFRGAFWFTFCACVLSGIGNLVLIYLDQRAEKRVRIAETSLDKNLSHPLYLLNLIACNFFFGAMTVVYSMPHYLSDTYGYDETEATNITLIIYVFAIVLSPLCGYIVDTLGRRDTLLLSGMITLAASFLLLTFSNITAILLMIFIGLAYALVPIAVPLIVHSRKTAKAFGVNYAVYDFMVFAIPIIFGHFYDITDSYTAGLILLTFQTFVALMAAFGFWLIDWKYYGSFLQQPSQNPPNLQFIFNRFKK